MKKIMIIGSGGAGKTTLSMHLSEKLDIPVVHLDAIYWKPGWVGSQKEEWEEKQKQALSGDKWIVDGNYISSIHLRLEQCDTVIFLNFSKYLCLYNVLKRYFQYRGKTRPDLNSDCPERIDFEFLQWIWNFPRYNTPAILDILAKQPEDLNIYVMESPKEIRSFLTSL